MSDSKSGPVYKHADIPLTSALTLKPAQENKKTPVTGGKDKKNSAKPSQEIGGPEGPEPTRYGDWERKGRCVDF
jgi:hypothetical protein